MHTERPHTSLGGRCVGSCLPPVTKGWTWTTAAAAAMQFWLATPPVRAILISANALDPVVRSRGHRAPGELFGGDGRPSGSHLRATIRPLSDDVIPRNACRWCVQVSKWTGWTTEKRANNLYSAALLTMSRIYMGFYPRKIIRFFSADVRHVTALWHCL